MNMQQPNQQQIQIKVSEALTPGTYANSMGVAHTKEEFIMDFMNLIPHQGVGMVVSRVITSPGHMKRILAAMKDNVEKYEKQFGKIAEAQSPQDIGFRTQ